MHGSKSLQRNFNVIEQGKKESLKVVSEITENKEASLAYIEISQIPMEQGKRRNHLKI